jgi:Zn-finger nucleic acid-binding protein
MVCTTCGARLVDPPVFPGATVPCACGAENVVPPPAASRPAGATPYRDPALIAPLIHHASEAAMLTCPFCGAPCTSEARACPHCDVELAAVRCPHCFALHFTGARFCSRCRAELHAEPLLDAGDAPCPRCTRPLRGTRELGVFECTACGGLFVDHTAFAALAAEKEAEARPYANLPPPGPLSSIDTEVHYVKCPVCTTVMNRINFGHRSGVIVDVCGRHGTWFDAGELTRVLEWIASGALENERARERAERERVAAHVAHGANQAHGAAGVLLDPSSGVARQTDTLLEMLGAFLTSRFK